MFELKFLGESPNSEYIHRLNKLLAEVPEITEAEERELGRYWDKDSPNYWNK